MESPSSERMVKRAVPPSPKSCSYSRRNLALKCNLLETQAIEEDEDGVSQSCSSNSPDDRDESNLSYVTDGMGALPYSTGVFICILKCITLLLQARIPTATQRFTMHPWEARRHSMDSALRCP